MKRIWTIAVLLLLCLCLSGCLQYKEEEVVLTLRSDLSGNLLMKFNGITSNEKDVALQEKELKEFYEKNAAEFSAEFLKNGFQNVKTEMTNRKPLSCDANLTAEFENLLVVLPVLFETMNSGDFEVVKKGKRISITVPTKKIAETIQVFSLSYEGPIVEDNSNSKDAATHTLKWQVKDPAVPIHFVLEVD